MLTPCIGICKLDPYTERCVGCARTRNQIAHWSSYSDIIRKMIMEELEHVKLAGSSSSANKPVDDAKNGT